MKSWQRPKVCAYDPGCGMLTGHPVQPCSVCDHYVIGGKLWRYRVVTRMTEGREFLAKRWEIVAWMKEFAQGCSTSAIEFEPDRERYEIVYYFSDATLGTLFKLSCL